MTEKEIKQDSFLDFVGMIEQNVDFTFLDYLSENKVIALSKEQGLVIVNRAGNIVGTPLIGAGLHEHDIKQILLSQEDELWILRALSLQKIDLPSTLNILKLAPELYGRIYKTEILGKRIFLGSSKGIFVAEPARSNEGQWKVRQITGSKTEAFHLMSVAGESLFAAGPDRLVYIQNEQVEEISKASYTGIQAISQDQVIVSGDQGLLNFQRTPNGWAKTNINPLQTNAFSFVQFKDRVFLLSKNEVNRLSKNLEVSQTLPFHREGLLLKLFTLDNQLYLISDIRAYRYEHSEETFLPVENDQQAKILRTSSLIIPDNNRGYWRMENKYKTRVIHQEAEGRGEAESLSYPVLQNLGEIIDLNIRDSVLFLTGLDKVLLFKLRLLNHTGAVEPPFISPDPNNLDGSSAVSSAVFQISGMELQSNPDPEFRYRLLPEEEHWSDWNPSRELVFDRLKPGDYTLMAQSKNLYGRISDPSEIQFNIKAPFYRSWYAYVFYGFVFIFGLLFIRKLRHLSYRLAESRVSLRMQSKLDDLIHEKAKSDKIVADILPNRAAQQIRLEGKAKWDKFERATVLFSDIQGFTKIAEEMNPEALIDELDQFFFHFDSVVEKYNIEKIKTIGDAYMAAGGIPEKNSTNPVEVVLAALEMQTYMQKLKLSKAKIWDLRIGIHTGPVIAGVIGHKKVSYDIWGDTVNTASRMESSGIPGKVNISAITYGMVKDYFICEYRGKLPVKYKGNIDMYFVTGLRPELAVDLKGIPNKRFFTKLQILRLGDLEDRVFENILSNLPDSLHFHTIEYARKIYSQSFLLCRAEEVEQEDRLLIRTAALMLYTGLTQTYSNYQNRSSVISRDILPEFKYSETQIDKICNLIMSTKLPFQPNNQREKILIDSKMEYLGKPDYPVKIKLLFKEMVETGTNLNGQQFKKQQLELLYTFDYYTIAARRLREISGEEQQTSLEQERWI